MFSVDYFKYLFKSKKYLVLLIGLIGLMNCLFSKASTDSVIIQELLSYVLCFIIPIDVFYHIHDKKAIDTYFSLPISRKAMLISGLLFTLAVIYIPLMLVIIFNTIIEHASIFFMIEMLFKTFIAIVALILFNSAIYSITNNIIDGIIIIGAYSFLPLFILMMLHGFLNTFVAGQSSFNLDKIGYLSPTYLAYQLFHTIYKLHTNEISGYADHGKYIIALIIYAVISFIVLYKNYVDRKLERVSSPSNGFFTYPFIIAIYVFLMLFLIPSSSYYVGISLSRLITNSYILYILLFAVFIAAHFIYHRKFYFSYKLVIYYLVAMLLSIFVVNTAINTRGFGLADNYLKNDPKAEYHIYYYHYEDNENKHFNEIKDYILENTNEKSDYIDLSIDAFGKEAEISNESAVIFEKYRKQAIDDYYEGNNVDGYVMNLYVNQKGTNYSYYCQRQLSLDDLKALAKDKNITITISCSDKTYQLNSDLEFVVMYE